MNMYLVFSEFTSRPISLLASNRVSAFGVSYQYFKYDKGVTFEKKNRHNQQLQGVSEWVRY
jgi:uncharacterized protein YcfL